MSSIATSIKHEMSKTEHLTQDTICRQLDASREAVEAALCAIYDRQTAEEKAFGQTIASNGVGFNRFDSEFCTSLVQQLKRGKSLTPRQLAPARLKMKRYWRQLLTVMNTEPPAPREEIDVPMRVNSAAPEPVSNDYGTW